MIDSDVNHERAIQEDRPIGRVGRGPLGWTAIVLSTIAGLGLLPLVGLTVVDVARRQLTGRSILGAVEIVEVGMVCIIFLAMMGAQVNQRHIRTPLLTNRLPSAPANAVRLLGCLIALVFLPWLTYETALVASDSFSEREYRFGIVQVPVWPARVCIPLGMAGLAVTMLAESLELLGRLRRGEKSEFVEVESNL